MERYGFALFCVFFPVALCLHGCATGDSVVSPAFHTMRPASIAIVDVSGDIRGDAPKNQVSDFFAMELLRKGYRVIDREGVDKLLSEQQFQRSEVTSADEAARMGEILNVPAVALLNVRLSGEKVILTGRLVATETAEILWIGAGRGGTGQMVATIGGAVAGAAAGSQVGGGSGRTAATIAGGVLGGFAGHALAPQEARIVQRAVRQMTDDLPQR